MPAQSLTLLFYIVLKVLVSDYSSAISYSLVKRGSETIAAVAISRVAEVTARRWKARAVEVVPTPKSARRVSVRSMF